MTDLVEIEHARMLDALPEPERSFRLAQISSRVRHDAGIMVSPLADREALGTQKFTEES